MLSVIQMKNNTYDDSHKLELLTWALTFLFGFFSAWKVLISKIMCQLFFVDVIFCCCCCVKTT